MSDLGIIGHCFTLGIREEWALYTLHRGCSYISICTGQQLQTAARQGPVEREICGSKPSSLPKSKSLLKMSLGRPHYLALPIR